MTEIAHCNRLLCLLNDPHVRLTPFLCSYLWQRSLVGMAQSSKPPSTTALVTSDSSSQRSMAVDVEKHAGDVVAAGDAFEKPEDETVDPFEVGWDGPDDPDNPLNMPEWRKWWVHARHLFNL